MAGVAATIAAIGGLVISATATTASFVQAGKQRKARDKAAEAAEKKMNEARRRLETNYMESLSIPKEVYEQEYENLLVGTSTALELTNERGAAAGAGRVLQAQQEGARQTRIDQAADVFNLERAIALEESRLSDIKTQLDIEEATGAQAAAADAEAARMAAINQGIQGVGNTAQQGLNMVPLFKTSKSNKQIDKMRSRDPKFQQNVGAKYGQTTIGTGEKAQVKNIADLTPNEFRDYLLNNFSLEDLEAEGFSTIAPTQQNSPFEYKPISSGNTGSGMYGVNNPYPSLL